MPHPNHPSHSIRQTKELSTAVDEELTKYDVQICRLLKLHYANIMEQTNGCIAELQASLTDITKSSASPAENTILKNCEKRLTEINKKWEAKAEEFKQTFQRKRARDTETDLTLEPIKRPRITTMVLNNTVDRNAAITQLIEAVNEVGSELNQSIMHNINSHSPAPPPPPPAARQQKAPAPTEPSIAKRMRAEEDTEEEEETKREAEEEAAPTKQTETEKTT